MEGSIEGIEKSGKEGEALVQTVPGGAIVNSATGGFEIRQQGVKKGMIGGKGKDRKGRVLYDLNARR